jgi:hypothetical protein
MDDWAKARRERPNPPFATAAAVAVAKVTNFLRSILLPPVNSTH